MTKNNNDTFCSSDRITKSEVQSQFEGVRLDIYLADRFTYYSRTGWRKIIEDGRILVAGHTVRASRKLHTGETVEFLTGGMQEPDVNTDFTIPANFPEFLAVDKPAPLPVHPAGCYFHNTLLMLLQKELGTSLYLVNRLDRETSGIVLFAKTPAAAKALAELFQKECIHKIYYAAVYGLFPEHRICNGWLIPDTSSQVNKKRCYTEDKELATACASAETCSTEFSLLEYRDGISLLRCEPHTGRLHQIRATLCSCGFPLVGDKLYGPDDTIYLRFIANQMTETDRTALRIDRQALHAAELRFKSPFDGTAVIIRAPIDTGQWFQAVRDCPISRPES